MTLQAGLLFTPEIEAPQTHILRKKGSAFGVGMEKRLAIITIFTFMGSVLFFPYTAFAEVANYNPPYPRLYAHAAGIKTVDPEVISVISRYNVVMFGLWRTWNSNGYTVKTLPAYIKSYNPDVRLLMAQSIVQTDNTRPKSVADIYDKMYAEKGTNGRSDWWLRTADGAHIIGYKSNRWRRNISPIVTPDSQGRNPGQWHFQWLYAKSTDGVDRASNGYGMREGDWDGIYEDDQYLSGYFSPTADYNSDGVNDNPRSPTVQQWIIDGHWSYRNAVKAAEPGWLFFGNIASYLAEIDSGEYAMPASLVGINDGAIFEKINQREFYKGWEGMMRRYRLGLSWLAGPKAGVFMVDIKTFRDLYPAAGFTTYRWNRYAMCSSLMDNGYYSVHDSAYGEFQTVPWFDEFWGGALKKTGYLGYPVEAPQLSPWSNGVYRREYTNGLVLVNPRGNGRQTINVGTGWKRILGTEDPIHNNGQTVSTITLDEQDGIILLRASAAKAPLPPSGLTIIN